MATVDINGTLIDFPDDLPPDQLQKAVASAAQQMNSQAQTTQSEPGLIRRGLQALTIPEKMSRQGLQMIAERVPDPEPTGKEGIVSKTARLAFPELAAIPKGTLGDVARGAPKVMAETLAETAPGFVSRGSILTAGIASGARAVSPIAKTVLRGLGKQGESLSGSMPGSLEAAYKDASLMFGKGRESARQAYESAKAGEKIQYGEKLASSKKFFDDAISKAKAGVLGPVEALEARKVADDLYESGRYVGDEIMQKRKILDEVSKKAFGAADKQFKRALQSESLRNILPQNKYGGTSAFKIGVMTALRALGPVGKALSMTLSPIVQGAAATGAGIAARQLGPAANNPAVSSGLYSAISEALRRRKEPQ